MPRRDSIFPWECICGDGNSFLEIYYVLSDWNLYLMQMYLIHWYLLQMRHTSKIRIQMYFGQSFVNSNLHWLGGKIMLFGCPQLSMVGSKLGINLSRTTPFGQAQSSLYKITYNVQCLKCWLIEIDLWFHAINVRVQLFQNQLVEKFLVCPIQSFLSVRFCRNSFVMKLL